MFKVILGASTVIAAVSSSVAALAQALPVALGTRMGDPLGIQMPGAESGLMILAAAGVISGIYIARRKR